MLGMLVSRALEELLVVGDALGDRGVLLHRPFLCCATP